MNRDANWWEQFWKAHTQGYGSPRATLLGYAEEFLKNHPGASAVDIASGDGRYALPLAKMGFAVDAIEFAQSGVDLINQRAKEAGVTVNAMQGDFINDYADQKQYDVVFCSGLLEEINSQYHKGAIERFMSWTKPGGLNIIKYCVWIKDRGELVERGIGKKMYEEAGWTIVFYQGPEMEEEQKTNVQFDQAIQSDVKTETIVATKK